jgi:cytochrome P450
MATDVIGELTFGKSFEMLENGGVRGISQPSTSHFTDSSLFYRKANVWHLNAVGKAGGIRAELPRFLEPLAKLFGIHIVGNVVQTRLRALEYAEQSLKRQFKIHDEGDDAKPSLFDKLYQQDMTFVELRDSATTYIVAGSDTTVSLFCRAPDMVSGMLMPVIPQANTLTYLLFSVLTHADVKAKLLDELKTLPEGFEYNQVKSLPYLNKVIDETLRMYPATPGNLPRDVPSDGVVVKGHYIPGRSVVGSSAYLMQRNAEVLPDSLKFDPSRWEKPTQEMKDSFMPFGAASRSKSGSLFDSLFRRVVLSC